MKVIQGSVDEPDPPPCPTWFGRSVKWEAWKPAPVIFVCPPSRDDRCPECGSSTPRHTLAIGRVRPLPGETVREVRPRRTRTGKAYGREVDVSAVAERSLMAFRCVCGVTFVTDTRDSDAGVTLICDGCDGCVAVGGDDAEAMSTLAAAGGLSERAGKASKDWCADCVASTVTGSTAVGRGSTRQQSVDLFGEAWND